ncbi:MAG: glycosyltransferase, partial [Pseudomonadota bacterium]
PEQPEMWERERRFAAWCGDVYKVIPILREYRPDLTIHVVEAFVGPYRKGLAIVSGLNPEDTTLSDSLLTLEEDILGDRYNAKDVSALEAMVQVSDFKILKDIKRSDRANGLGKEKHRQSASVKLRSTSPQQTQKISLVLCAFNMSRELPRTLKSLLPSMQSGVRSAEYELIVVDNGSSPELSIDDLNPEQTDVRLIRVDDAAVSPCAAINRAVERTDGSLVGIMVDGARLASPGLLTSAFDGLALSERALFGVHGYHLGDDIQQRSSQLGYDQDAEDDLLRSIEWEKDGYRLFEVSVPSKSSGKGLFTLPSESNAVFMHRDFWHELGGYDERFESPGGGLANLDFWKRACEADGAQPVIALSEGTFHQFHGGTSTDGENTLREHFHSEYERIRGQKYLRPNTKPIFIGPPNPFVLKHLEQNRISDNAAR